MRYVILDVFTDTVLAGNPLAVVLGADGLSHERMQAIAREFNLSETVFVSAPMVPVHSARLRIFTPQVELPFAGHPTVGTAVLLASERLKAGTGLAESVLILEEKIGLVRCGVFLKNGGGRAIFDAPKRPEAVPATLDRDLIAGALGLVPAEVGFENHVASVYTAGNPFIFVPVRDLEAAGKIRADATRWARAFGNADASVFAYTRSTFAVGRQFHARMFAPGMGLSEDPATGSAAVAFAGVIHRFDAHPSGTHRFVIEQGFEMGRPSLMTLEVDIETAGIDAVRLGGDAVIVAEGTLRL